MKKAFSAPLLFDGTNWLKDHAVICNDGIVERVIPKAELPPSIELETYPHHILFPAFIDVQVYGSAGKLFSVERDEATLKLMADVFAKEGTVLFQPTIATNTSRVIKESIDAVREYKLLKGRGVHGLHIEGPWINSDKRGAHIKELVHAPAANEVKDLMEYGKGVVTMVTLAPEVCSQEIVDIIRSYGVVVSAGHSDANFTTATQSFEGGISAVTHLFNAMSPLHHREGGLPGAAMLHQQVRASIIPDGYHVSYEVIKIAKAIMGERLFVITDAVTETSEGPYQHVRNGDKYECNGTLSGSALSMHQAFFNLVHEAGIDKGEAHRMCSLYPARVLGLDKRYGRIAPQFAGQFLVMNEQLKLVDVIT
jgi:N-acetylglucosamine-6-phosphate deacetylase